MAYHVQVNDAERAFLAALPLSAEALRRVEEFLRDVLGNVSDDFRNDPANRHEGGGPYFRMQFVLADFWGSGRTHRLDFIVNDSAAASGVLVVVFVDFF